VPGTQEVRITAGLKIEGVIFFPSGVLAGKLSFEFSHWEIITHLKRQTRKAQRKNTSFPCILLAFFTVFWLPGTQH